MADLPAGAKMVRRELKSLEIILFLQFGTVKWQKVKRVSAGSLNNFPLHTRAVLL